MTKNILQRTVSQGISIFTACHNRSSYLEKSLSTWLACDDINEIIIVNWCSVDNLEEVVKKHNDQRIILINVKDNYLTQDWVQSKAFNLAARSTSYNKICKLDSDYLLNKDFFKSHQLIESEFYTGNWKKARDENEAHLNGCLYIYRDQFFNINGYNEMMRGYGGDDTDLYSKLERFGLTHKYIDTSKIYHIPHSNKERGRGKTPIEFVIQSQTNRIIGEQSLSNSMAEFKVEEIDNNNYDCIQISENEWLDKNEIKRIKNEACVHIAKKKFGKTWKELSTKTSEEIENMLIEAKNLPLVAICPKFGLGNRLRTLASFQTLAEKTKREFQICWEESEGWDDSEFNDLFLNSYHIITNEQFKVLSKRGFNINEKIIINQVKQKYVYIDGFQPKLLFDTISNPEITYNGNESLHNLIKKFKLNRYCNDYYESYLKTLRAIKPIKEIQNIITAISCNFNKYTIGVHIRKGDALFGYNKEKYKISTDEIFMEIMDRYLYQDSSINFFLSTDCQKTESIFLDKYKDKIITYQDKKFTESEPGFPKENQHDAVVDMYCLSATKKIIATNWSSFSEVASEIGGSKLIIAQNIEHSNERQ